MATKTSTGVTTPSTGRIKLAFNSHPAIDSFREELRMHPELYERLKRTTTTFEDIIAEVATEVGVILDGIYVQEDVVDLLMLLVHKLRDKRKVIITSLN